MSLRSWLQIGRIQTYPADWLLVMVPFLHGRLDLLQALILSILMWFAHLLSFGQNSLLDSCIIPERGKPPPDFSDPSKQHHPLILGTISLHTAKNVIFWGLGCLTTIFAAFTLLTAENLPLAMTSLFLYYVWGSLYNEGLSKESPVGFMSISLSFTFMGAWAWFLTHKTLDYLGMLYVGYVFFTIFWQIAYEGHLKELEIRERSNILSLLGAKVVNGKFYGGGAKWFGFITKIINLALGFLLLLDFSHGRLVWFILMSGISLFLTYQLVREREWKREKELFHMSLQEISVIYLPIFILLEPLTSILLMLVGISYFFLVNLILWGTPYPRV